VPEIFPLALSGGSKKYMSIIDDAYIVIILRKKGEERYSSLPASAKENPTKTTKPVTQFDFSEGTTSADAEMSIIEPRVACFTRPHCAKDDVSLELRLNNAF